MKTILRRLHTLLAIAVVAWSCLTQAATITWIGGTDSNWQNAANWTPAQVPTAADTVSIPTGTVHAPSDSRFGTLVVSGGAKLQTSNTVSGTLVMTNAAQVSGPLVVAGGGVLVMGGGSVSGWVRVEAGGTLESVGIQHGKNLFGGLTNAGTIRQSGWGLQIGNGTTSVNEAGGTWEMTDDSPVYHHYGTEIFRNEGLLVKSGGTGTSGVSPTLTNLGIIEVRSGTLALYGGGQMDGTWVVAEGARVDFSAGNLSYTPPVNWTGLGEYRFVGGTLTLDRVIPNLQLAGGTLSLAPGFQGGAITNFALTAGTLTTELPILGTLVVSGGAKLQTSNTVSGTLVMTNAAQVSGPLVVAGGGVLVMGGGSVSGWVRVEAGGTLESVGIQHGKTVFGGLTNAGTIRQSGWGLQIGNGTTSVNEAGGRWEMTDDSPVYHYYGTEVLRNEGLLVKSGGTGTSGVSPTLTNLGTIEVQSGTLGFYGAFTLSAGSIRFGLSANDRFGRITIPGQANLGGGLGAMLLDGYVPAVGATFDVMTFGSREGDFTDYSGLSVGSGRMFNPVLSSTTVSLAAAATNLVALPPAIVSQPRNVTGDHGGSATFSATVSGTPPLQIQWWKNTSPVPGATSTALTLTNLTFADAASYTVSVTNSTGVVVSGPALLTVVPVAPVFVLQPVGQTVTTGSDIVFRVGVIGSPEPSLQWRRDGMTLTDGGRIAGSTTSELTLRAVEPEDAGTYTAVATNEGGAVVSQGAVLIVMGPPEITRQPASRTVAAGGEVVFAVIASGAEPLSYQWRLGSVDLADGARIDGAMGASLSITNVQSSDAGDYTVVVSNAFGAVTSQVAVLSVNATASLVYNGDFSLPVPSGGSDNGWTSSNIDYAGGHSSSGGNPGGFFILNHAGGTTDPTIRQTVSGLMPGVTYRLEGDYRSYYIAQEGLGFAVDVDGVTIARLGPTTTWVHFTYDVVAQGNTLDIQFRGEVGNDSDFAIDNIALWSSADAGLLITQVGAAPGLSGCDISWRTDKPATAMVEYGTGTTLGQTSTFTSLLKTNHLMVLTGLDPGTVYFYRVRSTDAEGNTALYSSADTTFQTLPAADLVVENLAVSAFPALQAGAQAVLRWDIANVGGAEMAVAFQERIQVRNTSTGEWLVDVTQRYDPRAPGMAPLGPDETQSRSHAFTLPAGTRGAGELSLSVTVDIADDVFESQAGGAGESNNSATLTRTSALPAYPDLAVADVVSPATGLPGSTLTAVWAVLNSGTTNVAGAWTERVFLVNPAVANDVRLLGSFVFTNTLAPGALITRTQSVEVPIFASGTFLLAVEVDSANEWYEVDEANNYRLAAQTLTLTPALGLSFSRESVAENAGSEALSLTVTRAPVAGIGLAVVLDGALAGKLVLPGSVVIPAGQGAVVVRVGVRDDALAGGDQTQTITASAFGHSSGQAQVLVVENDPLALTLTLSTNLFSEGAAFPAALGTVTRNGPTEALLEVALMSDRPAKAFVLASVTIPAGSASATFPVTAVDNDLLDGVIRTTLSATAPGHLSGSADLEIVDDDAQALTLTLAPLQVVEGAAPPAAIGTVKRSRVSSQAQWVRLRSADPAVSVPVQVLIPSGEAAAEFGVEVPDDDVNQGGRSVRLTAEVVVGGAVISEGMAEANLEVLDNDGATLTLLADLSVVEEGKSTGAIVRRSVAGGSSLVVTLTSSDPGEASVPATVTIPAGQVSAGFTIAGVADGVSDGVQAVSITAVAAEHNPGLVNLTVSDWSTPDLRVAAVTVPGGGFTSSRVAVTWSVANTGSGVASGSWLDRVYLSSDDQVGGDTLVASVAFNGSVQPGETYSQTREFALPDRAGPAWLIVVTDSAGYLDEASDNNNIRVSGEPVLVSPDYTATVQTDVELVTHGSPVVVYGQATSVVTGQQAANRPVRIHVRASGTERTLAAMSGSDGRFEAVFQPLSYEAGYYEVWAGHPGVSGGAAQDSFWILGMKATPGSDSFQLVPGVPYTRTVTIENLANVPLSGLRVEVLGDAPDLEVQASVTDQLGPREVGTLEFAITAPDTVRGQGRLILHVTSEEGAEVFVPLDLWVVPWAPQLASSPGYLEVGMVVRSQRVVEFEVLNHGGAASGDIGVDLPEASWLSLVSASVIPSLEPGGKTTVALLLSPPGDLALGRYDIHLVFRSPLTELVVPVQVRAVSDAIGMARVTVADDYTYHVQGAPKVAEARVRFRDPYDMSRVTAQGLTDTNGVVLFPTIPEGRYVLEVEADKHAVVRQTVSINPGVTNDFPVFAARQTITYRWTVVPTEIEDRYRVALEPLFEANVPAPVVTLELPPVLPLLAPGERAQIDATVINHGLIAADHAHLTLPQHPNYRFSTLTEDLGVIPAKSAITVPVIVEGIRPQAQLAGAEPAGLDPFPCYVLFYVASAYWCAGHEIVTEVSTVVWLEEADCDAPGDWQEDDQRDIERLARRHLRGGFTREQWIAIGIGAESLLSVLPAIEIEVLSCSDVPGAMGSASLNAFRTHPDLPPGSAARGAGTVADPEAADPSGGGTPAPHSRSGVGLLSVPPSPEEGVCARVRLRIEQDAVLVRTVFAGTLEIENGSGAGAVEGVRAALDIRDESGNEARDRFVITGPELEGVTAVDGTGRIEAASEGTARFTFIPTRDAAALEPTVYRIGGTLRYLDPDSGLEVLTPLFPAVITVYPDANLVLKYFQQRDVYGDDPFTSGVTEPSEPFSLGLLVQNTGRGAARDFRITSAQPRIIENEKGLLIDFKIIGAQVGTEEITPSLAVDLGTIEPGHSQVARWLMTSTLQGKFIEYSARFEHSDELGGERTSLIENTEVHELVHVVRDDRAGADALMDFLVNDLPDPDNLPDTLHLSDGTLATVSSVTNGVADAVVTPVSRQIRVTAALPAGWVYLTLPDPGPGYQLFRVVRSDGKEIRVKDNAWTTDRTFPAAQSGARREHRLHLFDHGSTGSYTLYYRADDAEPPSVLAITDPGVATEPVASVDVTMSEVIDPATFTAQDVTLTRNGGANLIAGGVAVTPVSDLVYRVNGLSALTEQDGNYVLTVSAAGIQDLGGNPGNNSLAVEWAKGTLRPVASAIEGLGGPHLRQPVDALDVVFSKPLDFGSVDVTDFTLTRDGGGNLLGGGVGVIALGPARFRVTGLAGATGVAGRYVFTVIGSGVRDTGGSAGDGSLTREWTLATAGPRILGLQAVRPDPRNFPILAIEVAFAEPINPATFDFRDLSLTRDGGANLMTGAARVERLTDRRFRIGHLHELTVADGSYRLEVSLSAIEDMAGNTGGESASTAWTIDRTPPAAPSAVRVLPDGGIASDDGLVSVPDLVLRGSLAEAGLVVTVQDELSGEYLGEIAQAGTAFELPLTFAGHGAQRLRIRATDTANNTSEARVFDLFIDRAPPVARLGSVLPSPRTDPADRIEVFFSEPVNPATFDRTDLVLRRDGGANLVSGVVRVQQLSSLQYAVSGLAELTAAPGQYELTLNAATIEDHAGNAGLGTARAVWETVKPNTAPVLAPVSDRIVTPGGLLLITNRVSDPDVPPQELTFALLSGAPAGARLDPATGVFSWVPNAGQAPSTHVIRLRVSDNGVPVLSDEIAFTVVVREAASGLVITGQPSSQELPAGADAVLAVTVQGSPPIRYQWTFNGVAINGATNGVLTLTNVQPPDSGGYRVRVSSPEGSTNSALATLLVASNEGPPEEVAYENMSNPQAGAWASANECGDEVMLAASRTGWLLTRLELLVQVSETANGNELAQVRLYANDGPTLPGLPDAAAPGTLLYDSGLTVPLAPGTNTVRISDLGIVVHERLTWTVAFSGVTAGESVGLLLYEPPTVGDSPDDLWEKTGAVWSLSHVPGKVANFGARLTGIQGPGVRPEIMVEPVAQQVGPGDPVAFVVVADGWPSPQYQWRHAGTNLVDRVGLLGAKGPVLVLSGVDEADAGVYDVIVSNAAGATSSAPAMLELVREPRVRLEWGTNIDHQPTLEVRSTLSGPFVVERSADLTHWEPVSLAEVNVALNLDQVDPHGGELAKRFFRARTGSGAGLTVATPALPGGTVGAAYNATLAVTGGIPPYTWSVLAGSLPAGITLSAAGVLSGTPTAQGTGSFTVRVKDSLNLAATKALAINVQAGWLPAGTMVRIEPGTFTIGSPITEQDRYVWEGPTTQVTLSKGFWMGAYEVTQAEYQAVTGMNPSAHVGGNLPVDSVSWVQAVDYCARLTAAERAAGRCPTSHVYRLPTEAEWEYACRAGTTDRFSHGQDPGYALLPQHAWFLSNSSSTSHAVGGRLPNPWGLYDMHGNVWEWCLDWHSTSYPGGSVTDPQGPATGSTRRIRGGDHTSTGAWCRSATRNDAFPEFALSTVGFRVVLAPVP